MAGKKKGLSRLKKHASTILAGTMVSVCALSPSLPDQVHAQTNEDAPGQPGTSSTWSTGAKNGIGTAFYNPKDGVSKSNVWYTLTNGILSEVYYPDVTRANLQEMQMIVTDGKSFVDFEKEDTTHQIRLVHQDAPVYRQINTDKEGKYRIEKTYITDPDHHTVLSAVTFYALKGKVSDYKVMIYSNPSVNNSGMDDTAKVVKDGCSSYLVASQADTALALTASVPFSKASSGYAGKSDGIEELKKNFKLESLYQSAENGNVAQIAELDLGKGETNRAKFTVSIGFGETESGSIESAKSSLRYPFSSVEAKYVKGWKEYIKSLSKPTAGNKTQFNAAAMMLKAHEDKLHPGAMIASLTVPWGEAVNADQGGVGGYHLVWSRDLYEVASSLAAIGDTETAKRALDYLDHIQQYPDGSFPQNSWIDGTPYWKGLQLDEVAYPIILANQIGETDKGRFDSLIKPAADFIVKNGPSSPQERWEEEGGYSPSTIATEIAGLVLAGTIAREHDDFGSAAVYLAKADEWEKNLEDWLVTRKAPLTDGKQPYYIRINDNTNPDDGSLLSINNGGGTYPENEIVDAGFLELVRLGIRPADDPLIVQSLDVIDKVIKFDSPHGPTWYRYNHDGYGEKADGKPYDGTGIGRPWPFLSGERAQYEIALGLTDKKNQPANVYGSKNLLKTMEGTANDGFMIPEQIWDGDPIAAFKLVSGEGTGSATPLAWSMAQYIRLAENIKQGKNVETPKNVADRYIVNRPGAGPEVIIESPVNDTVVTDSKVTIHGKSDPNTTVVLSGGKERVVVKTDEKGEFTAEVELIGLGKNEIDVVSYDNQRSVSTKRLTITYELPAFLEIQDPIGDDYGPGSYVYPTNPAFKSGDFDIKHIRASKDSENVYFEIQFGNLDNPWGGQTGISKQLFDIYIDQDGKEDSGNSYTKDLNARFTSDAAWEKRIRVTGNWHGDTGVYDNYDNQRTSSINVKVNNETNSLVLTVPIKALGGEPQPGWGLTFVVAGENNGGIRQVLEKVQEWNFGGGSSSNAHSHIIDMTVPEGKTQEEVLDWKNHSPVPLPTIRLK